MFTLAELDVGFGRATAILADRRDGAAMSSEEGPLRLILPEETRQGRWVRQVEIIEIREIE